MLRYFILLFLSIISLLNNEIRREEGQQSRIKKEFSGTRTLITSDQFSFQEKILL